MRINALKADDRDFSPKHPTFSKATIYIYIYILLPERRKPKKKKSPKRKLAPIRFPKAKILPRQIAYQLPALRFPKAKPRARARAPSRPRPKAAPPQAKAPPPRFQGSHRLGSAYE